jgi:ankyrin repeat protein
MPITQDELLLWAKTSNFNITDSNKKIIDKVQAALNNITEEKISLIMETYDIFNANLLFVSVAKGNFRAINLLKEKLPAENFNSLLFAKDKVGRNIFMYAVRHNLDTSFDTICTFITDECKIESMLAHQDKYGHTVPMYALFATDYTKKEAAAELSVKMIKFKSKISFEKSKTILSQSDKVGYTYLTWAVRLGCLSSIRVLSYSEEFHNQQADKLAMMLMKNNLTMNFIASIEFFPEDFASKVARRMASSVIELDTSFIENIIKKDNITDMKILTKKEVELWNANPDLRPEIFQFIANHKKWLERVEEETHYLDPDQVENKIANTI